jgi:hypothetical protein
MCTMSSPKRRNQGNYFSTSIYADKSRPWYFVITDIVETSTDQSTTPKKVLH